MKTFLYLSLCFSLSLISCGKISPKGNVETKDIEVADFKNLYLKGKFRAFYVRSPKNFVEVETYPNFYNNLKISVDGNSLNISEKKETKGLGFYSITIYSKNDLEGIAISDSVEMNVSSQIKSEKFMLNLKNSSKFIGAVNSKRVEVKMGDHSLANFKGFTQKAVLKISDTASIIAPYWFIDVADVDAKNGSYAEINAKDSIKGNIKNTAKLLYYNDPVRDFKIEKTTTVNNKKLEVGN